MKDDPNKVLDVEDLSRVSTDLPRSVRVAIADALIALSRMEAAAEELIWTLAELEPPTGRLLTAIDARPKFSIARTLIERKIGKAAKIPKDLWEKLDELRGYRNEIVHGVWVMLDKNTPFAVSYRTKDHRGVNGFAYTLERLKAIASLADQIGAIFDKLDALYRERQKSSPPPVDGRK